MENCLMVRGGEIKESYKLNYWEFFFNLIHDRNYAVDWSMWAVADFT